MELDDIDKLAAKAFEGYIVRKDLVRKFKGQYPVPTYVAEFLLGRYCSSIDEKEIEEGLRIVQRQLADRWDLSEASLERWRTEGIGPIFLKLQGRVLYRVEDVEAYEVDSLRKSTSVRLDAGGEA